MWLEMSWRRCVTKKIGVYFQFCFNYINNLAQIYILNFSLYFFLLLLTNPVSL